MSNLLDKFEAFEEKQETKKKIEVVLEKSTEKKELGKKPKKITGDKNLNKSKMIQWLKDYMEENKDNFTLDWLRGQKLTYESVNEMRKQMKRKVNK